MLDQRRFQSSVGYSALLHVGVVAVFFVGVPWLIDAPYQAVPILTVEVVDDVLRTNLDEGLPGKPEDEPQDEVNRQNESNVAPAAASAPPPPPDRPAESESEADASDAVALNLDGAAAETPPPKAKPQETKTPQAVAPPRAKPREPRQAPPQPPQDNVSSLVQNEQNTSDKPLELGIQLNNLLDEAQSLANAEEDTKKDEIDDILDDVLRQNVGQAVNVDKRDDGPLGADIITRLRAKIGRCWNPPSAIAGAPTLIVDIIVGLDARGEVVSVRIKDAVRYASDDAFKLAAEAAERAFRECSPLIPPLVPEDYEKWKSLQFRFDPRGFLT